jgi:hypothetical protein
MLGSFNQETLTVEILPTVRKDRCNGEIDAKAKRKFGATNAELAKFWLAESMDFLENAFIQTIQC